MHYQQKGNTSGRVGRREKYGTSSKLVSQKPENNGGRGREAYRKSSGFAI